MIGVISLASAAEDLDWPYELGVGEGGIFYAVLGFFGIVAIVTKKSATVKTVSIVTGFHIFSFVHHG